MLFRHSGRAERGPESIATILFWIIQSVFMDSGLRPAAGPGMTQEFMT
jgi:hypothetical protein